MQGRHTGQGASWGAVVPDDIDRAVLTASLSDLRRYMANTARIRSKETESAQGSQVLGMKVEEDRCGRVEERERWGKKEEEEEEEKGEKGEEDREDGGRLTRGCSRKEDPSQPCAAVYAVEYQWDVPPQLLVGDHVRSDPQVYGLLPS